MDDTPNLNLPYIMAAQAQKHVTHNEAIRALDAIVQIGVADRDLTTAPSSPAEGASYIVATGAGGAWSGKDHRIAAWRDGAWAFYAPREGWLARIADDETPVIERQQVTPNGLSTHQATLDDVFLHLTGRALKNGEAAGATEGAA